MKLQVSYNNNNVKGFISFKEKIKRVNLLLFNSNEYGEINITTNKIRGHYVGNRRSDDLSYYNDFFVRGLSPFGKIDLSTLDSDRFFNNLFDISRDLILDKVSHVKGLFQPPLKIEGINTRFSYKEKIGYIMRFKYNNISGKFIVPDFEDEEFVLFKIPIGINDILFLYNDGKRKVKFYTFSNYVIEFKYLDDKENFYMYFSGGRKANPVKELNEYLEKHKELKKTKETIFYFINTFLTSDAPLLYIREIVNGVFDKFKVY